MTGADVGAEVKGLSLWAGKSTSVTSWQQPWSRDDRGIHATLLEADDEEDCNKIWKLGLQPGTLKAYSNTIFVYIAQEEAKKEDKYNVDIQKIDAHWSYT